MKRGVKKFCTITIASILALVSIPVRVNAASEVVTQSATYVNPAYADCITEDELEQEFAESYTELYYSAPTYTSAQQIGEYLREKEKEKIGQVTVNFNIAASSKDELMTILSSAVAYAEAHTGSPTEGDYLRFNNGGYELSCNMRQSGGVYSGTATYQFAYFTSYEQEQQVTDKVNQVIQSLSLSGKSTEEKIRAIYGYITEHVAYDYANLNNDSYKLKHSTYAALINETAVCQGYASLFYRLCLEAGVDARIIAGTSDRTSHVWNIVKIGSVYYNMDSTYDSNYGNDPSKWENYLKAGSNFPDHNRNSEYTTSSFTTSYPMSQTDFDGKSGGEDDGNPSGGDDVQPYRNLEWEVVNGKSYWYENNVRQGTYDDPQGVMGDGTIRGREIYDPASNAWYWLDSIYDGAKACGKEVWMPYIYQNEANWDENEINNNAAASGANAPDNYEHAELADQVKAAIHSRTGKWVRYDNEGKMMKGWVTIEGELAKLYPDQAGNTYYYDRKTGLMAKGTTVIGGQTYYFDEITGVMK